MGLLGISAAKMFRISKRWISDRRPLLEGLPEGKALLPKIEEAHQGLLILSNRREDPPELTAIRVNQDGTDARHDIFLRVGFGKLELLIELSEDPNEKKMLLALRDFLFPGGLLMTTRSYDEEAGAAEMLEQRLKNEPKDQLKEIPIKRDYSLQDLVNDYISHGKKLGELENQKKALLQNAPEGPSRAEVQKARHYWIRVARALETNLALASDEATVNSILEDLRAADKVTTDAEPEEPIPAPEPPKETN
jgi:hypothetical protein